MMLTAEISMYPFRENYRAQIREFIDRLHTFAGLRIETTPTSTMVVGEYEAVMKMFSDMLQWSYNTHGRAVFVTKFIPGYEPE